jgi:hypothetical protein
MNYARVVPDRIAGTISVTCARLASPDETEVTVTYDVTSLGPEGALFVEEIRSGYDGFLESWAATSSAGSRTAVTTTRASVIAAGANPGDQTRPTAELPTRGTSAPTSPRLGLQVAALRCGWTINWAEVSKRLRSRRARR